MADNDQTQVPGTGQGQQGTPPTSSIDPKKLAEMQADLEKITAENQRNQSRADRAELNLQRALKQPSAQRTAPVPGPAGRAASAPVQNAVNEQLQVLQEVSEAQAKELLLLKEASRYGFTYEEVQNLQFDSPTELHLQLEVMKQRREVEELKAAMRQEPPEARVDTGGPSGALPAERSVKADSFRSKARELRKVGQHQEATWLALRAAHIDPAKRIIVTPEEEE